MAFDLTNQLLEHRYLMAERRGADVRTSEALEDYVAEVLALTPAERQLRLDTGSIPRTEFDPASATFDV